MKRLPALVLLVALVGVACGSSSTERDQALVDVMVDDILGENEDDAVTTDLEEARCIAEGTYDAIGEDRLNELGIVEGDADPTDRQLTDDEAEGTVDALFDCTDVKQSFADSIVGGSIDQDGADCIADELGDDGLRKLVLDGVGATEPPADFFATMETAGEACDVDIFG